MIKFTKEEISLCEQIANTGERRALKFGNFWFHPKGEQNIHVISGKEAVISLMEQRILDCFPLWTISDCLEFLKEKGILKFQLLFDDECRWEKYQICIEDLKLFPGGQTPLETCLKAVLAVLEEEK